MDTLSYPVTNHRVSDGWPEHLDRGSLGGIDHPVPMFTPVYATHDGWWSYDDSPGGSGGRVGRVDGDGISTEVLHLSSGSRNRNVKRGELVAFSGASAFGSNTGTGGPHVHWHAIINGVRVNPLKYLASNNSVPANGNIDSIVERMVKQMVVAISNPAGTAILIFPGGEYAVKGTEGKEVDGVSSSDRKVGGVIDAVWGKRIPLNGTDVNTVLALNRAMTAQMRAALR